VQQINYLDVLVDGLLTVLSLSALRERSSMYFYVPDGFTDGFNVESPCGNRSFDQRKYAIERTDVINLH